MFFDDFKVEHVKSPVVQMDDYYPFGLTFNSYSRENSTPQNYLYNGKEVQDELNLGWLDYGARMYQPEIGRWGVLDPMGDSRSSLSPYNYVQNNPLIYIDPNGMLDDYVFDQNGNFTGEIRETGTDTHRIVVQQSDCSESTFELNDPENDSKNLEYLADKYGTDLKVIQKSSSDVDSYMEKSEIKEMGFIDRMTFAKEESFGGKWTLLYNI